MEGDVGTNFFGGFSFLLLLFVGLFIVYPSCDDVFISLSVEYARTSIRYGLCWLAGWIETYLPIKSNDH